MGDVSQTTEDFDERFRVGDTPWEETVPAPAIQRLVRRFVPAGAHVMDVGCGLGTNAIWLARQGLRVTGCDISSTAIAKAAERARSAGVSVGWVVADVMRAAADLPRPDAVVTRGVLHTFKTSARRAVFAGAIGSLLEAGGLWLDVSGSADTTDEPGVRERLGLPRLSLTDIASAAEEWFEFLSVEQVSYGTIDATSFLAFSSALRRRS